SCPIESDKHLLWEHCTWAVAFPLPRHSVCPQQCLGPQRKDSSRVSVGSAARTPPPLAQKPRAHTSPPLQQKLRTSQYVWTWGLLRDCFLTLPRRPRKEKGPDEIARAIDSLII